MEVPKNKKFHDFITAFCQDEPYIDADMIEDLTPQSKGGDAFSEFPDYYKKAMAKDD